MFSTLACPTRDLCPAYVLLCDSMTVFAGAAILSGELSFLSSSANDAMSSRVTVTDPPPTLLPQAASSMLAPSNSRLSKPSTPPISITPSPSNPPAAIAMAAQNILPKGKELIRILPAMCSASVVGASNAMGGASMVGGANIVTSSSSLLTSRPHVTIQSARPGRVSKPPVPLDAHPNLGGDVTSSHSLDAKILILPSGLGQRANVDSRAGPSSRPSPQLLHSKDVSVMALSTTSLETGRSRPLLTDSLVSVAGGYVMDQSSNDILLPSLVAAQACARVPQLADVMVRSGDGIDINTDFDGGNTPCVDVTACVDDVTAPADDVTEQSTVLSPLGDCLLEPSGAFRDRPDSVTKCRDVTARFGDEMAGYAADAADGLGEELGGVDTGRTRSSGGVEDGALPAEGEDPKVPSLLPSLLHPPASPAQVSVYMYIFLHRYI